MSIKRASLSAIATLMCGTAMADVPNVAVDIAPVHSLVARVMEGVGEPSLILPPGASPHEHSLRPSEAGALQEADIVVWMGHDLTPWMEDAVETLAADASVMTLLEADETTLLDFREGALFEAHDHDHDDEHGHDDHDEAAAHDDHDHDHEEHAEHDDDHDHEKATEAAANNDHDHEEHAHDDHAHDHDDHADAAAHDDHDHDDHAGHDHGAHDPHAWLSPTNATTWLNLIAAELSAADPDNAGTYFANAAAARTEMEALSTEVATILEPARGKSFVVFHDAYQYFETDFDFPASGAISLGDATDPSPARIAEIQGRVRDEGVDCVLAEPQYNEGIVATVLEGTEAKTGVIDPLGVNLEPGPTLYPQLIRNMATTLADCL
ncbi:MAG: zinc ABC transporter substrate-binding protein [Pseudomonadota bacterium]